MTDELRKIADGLGIDHKPQWSAEKLAKEIEAAKMAQADDADANADAEEPEAPSGELKPGCTVTNVSGVRQRVFWAVAAPGASVQLTKADFERGAGVARIERAVKLGALKVS